MEVDSWLEEQTAGHSIIVFTPEITSVSSCTMTLSFWKTRNLFVFDEAHLLDDETRGPGYELLLAEIFRTKVDAQKVLISAVVSNADEIAEWAFGDSDRIVEGGDIQVTEKSIGVIREGGRESHTLIGTTSLKRIFSSLWTSSPKSLKGSQGRRKRRYFPDFEKDASGQTRDLSIYYANRLVPNGACAIYVPLRKSLSPLFKRLGDLVGTQGLISQTFLRPLPKEKEERLSRLVCKHYGERQLGGTGYRRRRSASLRGPSGVHKAGGGIRYHPWQCEMRGVHF